MTENELRDVCELMFLESLPDLIKGYKKNTRFAGLLDRISKLASKALAKLPTPNESETTRIGEIFSEFGKRTGWEKSLRSPVTMFCFCLRLCDFSQVYTDRMAQILSDIIDYVDRGGFARQPSVWAGDLACSKWLDLMGVKTDDGFNPAASGAALSRISDDLTREQMLERYREKIYGGAA